jgi:16S rRNA (cytidine1402-2'-O)-methyltransferase
VRDAVRSGLPVSPMPGPSALLAALSVAGLPTDRFTFEGFLPASGGARRRALQQLRDEQRTMVFYESPHRIADSLGDLAAAFGESREAALCRELTKRFETVFSADLGRLCRLLAEDDNQRRGEFVLVVAGREPGDDGVRAEWIDAVRRLAEWMPLKQASREVAELTGAGSQALYRAARRSGSE